RSPGWAASVGSPRATRPAQQGTPDPRGDATWRRRAGARARNGRTRPGSPACFWVWSSRRPSQRGVLDPGERGLVRKYLAGAAQAGVQRVAEGVAEEIERKNG